MANDYTIAQKEAHDDFERDYQDLQRDLTINEDREEGETI